MKVLFRVNLGSRDAEHLGIDFRDCTCGAEVDLPDSVAEILVGRGIAESREKKATRKKASDKVEVKTVPPVVDTKPAVVEVQTSEKPSKEDAE